ncbi:MAG: class III extradiol dioxygenase subunit B-like domain-containing protein [Candidatus Margulisiibacteriota bacterium]
MSNVIYGIIAPHPPIVIPEIGGKRIKEAENTKTSLEAVSKKLKSLLPDAVIIITPHGQISQATIHVYTSHVFDGDFSAFGNSSIKIKCKGDPVMGRKILQEAKEAGIYAAEIQESFLDHGILVPYYYLAAAGVNCPVLPISISLSSIRALFEFGKAVSKAAELSGKKIAVTASADMSHRLTPDAPSGFSPRGKEFDEKLVDLVKNNDVNGILDFDPVLAREAGQDALWSIAILLGALEGSGLKSRVLSYEAPFGVGYMVAEFI